METSTRCWKRKTGWSFFPQQVRYKSSRIICRFSQYDKKIKKSTRNPINKNDNKCFQYAAIVTLNHEKIGKNPERITKFKHFSYNWEGEGWHYIAVKKLTASLRKTMTKHNGHFYCFNCLHSFRTKNKLELYKKVSHKKKKKIFVLLWCLLKRLKY